MVRATIDTRTKAVLFYVERIKQANDICTSYDISRRTLTRWVGAYRRYGTQGLAPKKPGPRHSKHSIADKLEQKIVALKAEASFLGSQENKASI
ncbi:MAG: helix-turn-helix domain containing protein [Nitrososphaerota archaeon]|nr:helix-turn-helix domain containing protein [Nitrososphaerota archaeon]